MEAIDYHYSDAEPTHAHAYLLPTLIDRLDRQSSIVGEKRVFDLGCGNGSVGVELVHRGYSYTGVDPSIEGIEQGRRAHPNLPLFHGSCYDDLASVYGQFPLVISLEVIEHVFLPRLFAGCLFDLLAPGGIALISTPYHGYWKNLALAITGKWDRHFTALWDYGHIKFWSMKTLEMLLREAGFSEVSFCRVGRIPIVAKSMIAAATKPGNLESTMKVGSTIQS